MLEIGQVAARRMLITEETVSLFVRLSGDANPIHTDEIYARTTQFGRRIAPGMQVASLISAVLANDLPGAGTIYIEQNLRFQAPVFLGDTIEARVLIIDFPRRGQALLETICVNQSGERVIVGTALVKCP